MKVFEIEKLVAAFKYIAMLEQCDLRDVKFKRYDQDVEVDLDHFLNVKRLGFANSHFILHGVLTKEEYKNIYPENYTKFYIPSILDEKEEEQEDEEDEN